MPKRGEIGGDLFCSGVLDSVLQFVNLIDKGVHDIEKLLCDEVEKDAQSHPRVVAVCQRHSC